jgi:hypothetical protein
MTSVDPRNDTIRRYIVRHYRYDPQRHERRHVIVGAFDNRAEFKACMRSVHRDIQRRRAAGELVERNEHVSGSVRQPGDDRRAANGRLLMRSLRHGVTPGPWLENLELPSNIAMLTEQRPGRVARYLRRLRPSWLGRIAH